MRATQLLATSRKLDQLRGLPAPSTGDAVCLVDALDTGAAATYFFRQDYRNKGWLQRLAEVGAFRRYAQARAGKRRRWVIFRELTAYLHRVAEAEPGQVADILASLTTKDWWATGQLMKAALALPDEYAARVIPQFVKWCGPNNPFAREEDVIELAERMLRSRYEKEFASLLRLLLKPMVSREGQDVSGIFFDDRLVDFARGQFQHFCSAAPATCLEVAESCLRKAVPLRERSAAERWQGVGLERGKKPDPSSGIRSAIEEHEQDRYPDFEDGLVVAVRDALAAYVNQSPREATVVIRRYLKSTWSVFRRLALHTLTENTETYPKLAKSAVFRHPHGLRFFDDTDLHHEYWRLVPAVFDDLSPDSQMRLLKWINAGYPGADEREKQWFAYPRLKMLEGCTLPDETRRYLERLAAELGEADHPDFLIYSTSWAGGVSPESPADLEKMTIDDLYEFLDMWRPKADMPSPFGPSYRGVGGELGRLTKSAPDRYLPLVRKMTNGIDGWMASRTGKHWATYVGSLLSGYREACREGKCLDWSAALDLLERAVPGDTPPSEWPDVLPPSGEDQDWDADWRGVRGNVTNLIAEGIDPAKAGAIPDGELPRVRDILIRLTRDPFPTSRDEHEHEQKNADTPNAAPVDWHHFAINTNRPEAANVLLRYAVRHANPIVREKRNEPRVEQKVRDALTALADDPCRSVHSMLGSWLGVLLWLDGDWLKAQLGSFLPMCGKEGDLWEATWVAFLRFGTLYRNLHQHLVPHYERSISECARRKEDDPHLRGLCKHLAAIHTWKWDEVSEESSLISRFYGLARDDAACELAQAFGHFVRNPEKAGGEAPEQWPRIESLLRWRIERIAGDPEQHVKELRAFARW
ncbi:MAG TPA: hypothetical protein VM537_05335, partial [Anaerolineae bacterium]|nr:hypothetical protein [Anaerolineae bacterium]